MDGWMDGWMDRWMDAAALGKRYALSNDLVDTTDTRLDRLWRSYSRNEVFLFAEEKNYRGRLHLWSTAQFLLPVNQLLWVQRRLNWHETRKQFTISLDYWVHSNYLNALHEHEGMVSDTVAHLPDYYDKWRPTWVATATHEIYCSSLGLCSLVYHQKVEIMSLAIHNFLGSCSMVKPKPIKAMAQWVNMLDVSCM